MANFSSELKIKSKKNLFDPDLSSTWSKTLEEWKMLFWVSLNIMQVPGCQHGRLCCKEEELSTQSTWVKHRSYRTALGLSCPRGASVHPSDSNAHRDGICCSSAPEQSQGQLTLLKRCTCGPEVSRFLCCAQLNQFGTKRGESPLGAELPAVSIKLKKVKS